MNSKTANFKATSMAFPSAIAKSDEPARSAGKKMASDKQWHGANPTYGNSKMVPTSPVLKAIPKGGTKSHPSLSAKSEKRGPTYGNSTMVGAPKSGDLTLKAKASGMPKSWKSSGYSMETPSTLSKPKMKSKWSM